MFLARFLTRCLPHLPVHPVARQPQNAISTPQIFAIETVTAIPLMFVFFARFLTMCLPVFGRTKYTRFFASVAHFRIRGELPTLVRGALTSRIVRVAPKLLRRARRGNLRCRHFRRVSLCLFRTPRFPVARGSPTPLPQVPRPLNDASALKLRVI